MSKGFVEYKFGSWRTEIRTLLRKRLKIKERIRYHERKIEHHEEQIKIIREKDLAETEKELNKYLLMAGNDI